MTSVTALPAMRVLGTRVNPVQLDDALTLFERWIKAREPGRVAVVSGMHAVMEARRHPSFRAVVEQADVFIPDGYSLVWLARRKGFQIPQRVCGADVLRAFCALASQKGYRVFFYGDTETVLARLRNQLRRESPKLQIAGTYSPPFRPLSPEEDAEIVRRINDATPDVLWVGLGLPKQERWMAEHRARLKVPVLVGVGAAFKFVSGEVRKAPRWVGEHGLEWIWRFAHEPRRLWRRALLDVPWFTFLALRELLWAPDVDRRKTTHRREPFLKRPFDVLLACAGLALSLPLWIIFAGLIKLEDGGPVLYQQERVGRGGRRFRSLKFRSMASDSDRRFGILQARPNDERVTRVGNFLRATALDELPQLWNIARGDMSFVGPRALAPTEIEVGGNGHPIPIEAIPGYVRRQQVRPGLTGVAQIYAPRDVSRRKKFRYDWLYITHQQFGLDLRLIGLSFWITMRGRWESRADKL